MTNRITYPVLGLFLGLLMLFAVTAVSANAAKKASATVRAVTSNAKILVDKKLTTGTTSIKSSAKAGCFGPGSDNSSKKLEGPTALGLLTQASKSVSTVRPLSITNASDFGLGVCGIGGFVAEPTGFWLLRVNHAVSQLGAEAVVLKNNDITLWYQVADYTKPNPAELYLQAPAKVKKGKKAKVRVFAYDDKGKRKPAKGAKLSVNGAKTNSSGYAKVKVNRKTKIVARHSGTIPSNRVYIGVKK